MIRKTKERLYKVVIYPALFILFFIVIPIFLSSKFNLKLINTLSLFYLPNVLIIYFLFLVHSRRKSFIMSEIQKLQEDVNTEEDHIRKQAAVLSGQGQRLERYNRLKTLIEKINSRFELEFVSASLLDAVFELIGQRKGNCILYLVDIHTQKLYIYATKKEDPGLVIKAKQGDIFDYWVLRHTSSLLVEDIKRDFRFDLETTKQEYARPVRCLISAPLVSQERMLGIIRLDNPSSFVYTQDDLRFLNTISELGAVAIENAKLFKETQELAIKDSLTSCYTKGYFLERLKEEFNRSARKASRLSLLMVDIDYFKSYNDRFGHIAGDILLKEIGLLIREFSEAYNGLVSRFGGEEFCILLANTNKRQALELAKELRQRIQEKDIVLRQRKTSITVSIGVATYPDDVSEEEELIHKSDAAMYKAKQRGRNRVCGI